MGSHTTGEGLDALFLRRMAVGLDRGAASVVRGHGLTVDQWRMLDLLAVSGPLPMAALCEELSLAGATATRVADRLVDEELARRSVDDNDRRRVVLRVTGNGRDLRADLAEQVEQAQREQWANLGGADHERLAQLLRAAAGFQAQ
ncbi:MarR family transcriptional regulator [Nocardiopsis sp. HNM0947]|uniref:MarR family transcriptional regulator n=1 Tax=Nocardiopsis coralli TaxID=2772213 RepID=A0ABR9P3C5_9ACTN|nr:MarR family transcriptional regulator [Nocardiopsis coralli]MBE2998356.1 MarR family transcriptional regulator [Nocardiopsis coralli]